MKMKIIIAAFILAVTVAVSGQDLKKTADVDLTDVPARVSVAGKTSMPMEIFGRKPVVEVKINGQGPFKFFLDTGAGVTVLNQDLADE